MEQIASERAPPSEWALGELQRFRDVLGASYVGYEMEIMDLLMEIDARRQQVAREEGVKSDPTKFGGKGSWELKNLMSTINYDYGSTKCRNHNRDRVLVLSK